MIKKIQAFLIVIVLLSILVTGVSGVYFLSDYSENTNRQLLVSAGRFFSEEMKDRISFENAATDCIEIFSRSSGDLRITVIDHNGRVLFDSAEDATRMDNHSDRKEVSAAFLSKGTVFEKRYSRTIGTDMLYMADFDETTGTVVRISMPLVEYVRGVRNIQIAFIAVMIAAVFILSFFGYLYSKKLARPLRELKNAAQSLSISEYKTRITSEGPDEIRALTKAFNEMADRLEHDMSELEEKNKRLSELQDLKTEFAANVSHELKTPLTSIRGFIDTLRNSEVSDPEVRQRFLEIIDIEAQRLNQLINDVLQLSEIERLDNDPEKEKFNLSDLIDETVRMEREKAFEKNVEIIYDTGEDLPVKAGRFRVRQVLINLLDNAINYNREGGRIWVRAVREPDRVIAISVKDTGEGIAEEHLPRIFERFYRVDKSHSRELGGTGLGLSIVKHIAILYEGSTSVESKPGIGSTFTVRLRIADDLV
ncbi:MAG: HAMP domain-containing protein [Clostridiaceae bacterium]|nr:HAMP domain-containing protein [Clostridiaceae bacterium]